MAVSAFELAATLTLNSSEFENTLSAAKDSGSAFGKSFAAVGEKIKSVMTFTAVIKSIGAVVSKFSDLATKAAAAGDRVDKMSQKLGMSRKSFQQWDYILSQNGTSIDSMQTAMRNLQNAMADGANASDATVAAYKKLGLSMDELSKLSPEAAFQAVVKAFQELPPGAEKSALALDIFGRSGSQLLPLLNANAGSIEQLKQKAESLGIVLSDDVVDAAVNYTDAMDTFSRTTEAAKTSIAASLMPAVTNMVNSMVPLIEQAAPMITDALDGIVTFAAGALESITKALNQPTFAEGIKSIFSDIFGENSDAYGFISGIVDAGASIFDHISKGLRGEESGAEAIKGVFSAIFGADSTITKMIGSVVDKGASILSGINAALSGDTDTETKISGVFASIFGEGSTAANSISGIVIAGSAILTGIQSALEGERSVPEKIGAVFNSIFGAEGSAYGFITSIVSAGKSILTEIWTNLMGEQQTIGQSIGNVFSSIFGSEGPVQSVLNGVIDVGSNLIASIYSGITGNSITGQDVISWISTNIVEPITGFWNDIVSAGSNIIQGIMNGWNDALDVASSITEWVNTNIVAPITGYFSGLVDFIGGIWSSVESSFKSASDVINSIKTWVQTNITNPIKSMFQGIVDTVNNIITAIAKFLGFDGASVTVTTNTIENRKVVYNAVGQVNDPYAGSGVPTGQKVSGGTLPKAKNLLVTKAIGMDYVPYDGYKVSLHKGERILTALENRQYMRDNKLTEEGLRGNQTTIDYKRLGEAVAEALAGLSINMDSRQVGQLVAPTVSQSIMETANMRRYSL